MHKVLFVMFTLFVAACDHDRDPLLQEAARSDEVAPTRASKERRTERPPRAAVERETKPPLQLASVEVAEAEDGHGGVVAAVDPVAFDVPARLAPPRAREPELHVGALVLQRPTYPRPGIVRFVLADRGLLRAGDDVSVGYPEEPSRRIVVASALEVHP